MIRETSSRWLFKPLFTAAMLSSLMLAGSAGANSYSSDDAQATLTKMLSNDGISRGELDRFEAFIQSDRKAQFLSPDQAPAAADAAGRYGMDTLADRIQRGYVSNDLTTEERIGSPPPPIRGNNLGEYLSGIHANADGSKAEKLMGTTLTVYDRDGREMQVLDPVGGASIRNVALSCFYHSAGYDELTPNFGSYGTDILELAEPLRTYRLEKHRRDEEEWTLDTFEVSHVAMDWEAAEGSRFVGYLYGQRVVEQPRDTSPNGDSSTSRSSQTVEVLEPPAWQQYTCGASVVVTDEPIYRPDYRRFSN